MGGGTHKRRILSGKRVYVFIRVRKSDKERARASFFARMNRNVGEKKARETTVGEKGSRP